MKVLFRSEMVRIILAGNDKFPAYFIPVAFKYPVINPGLQTGNVQSNLVGPGYPSIC